MSRRRRQGLQALSLNESLLSCQRMEQRALMKTDSAHIQRAYIHHIYYTCTTPVLTFAVRFALTISHVEIWKEIPVFWIYRATPVQKGTPAGYTRGDTILMDDEFQSRSTIRRNTFLLSRCNGER